MHRTRHPVIFFFVDFAGRQGLSASGRPLCQSRPVSRRVFEAIDRALRPNSRAPQQSTHIKLQFAWNLPLPQLLPLTLPEYVTHALL
jgi:hypothetical protein